MFHTFNNNTSVFRRRSSQVARATHSYDRLHRFSRIVLCNIRHPVLFNAIRRSHVSPGLKAHADLLIGVKRPGEAGSGSAAMSLKSLRLEIG